MVYGVMITVGHIASCPRICVPNRTKQRLTSVVAHGLQDFRKIATFLEHRTTAECIVFYYKTQKLDEFAAVRRKQQLKKRRAQSEVNRSITYLGVAALAAAKRGALPPTIPPAKLPGSPTLDPCLHDFVDERASWVAPPHVHCALTY